MSEIDWSKAPEGATHYSPHVQRFIKECKSCYMAFLPEHRSGEWVVIGSPMSHQYIPRPTEQGEGLPPVGCECELNLYGYWFAATVLAYGKTSFIYEISNGQVDGEGEEIGGEQAGFLRQARFRPLKSQHERQREELIKVINECDDMAYSFRPDDIADAVIKFYEDHYNLEPKQ